jgi:hypothetical protein
MARIITKLKVILKDLAWHTHQLNAGAYRAATIEYLRRTPNHDDSVDALALSSGYDITAKAWRARFGVPYSICGCVPDPDAESRLSRFAQKIGNIGKKEEIVNGPLVNTRPDLVATEEEEADSSHPSEHNIEFGNPQDSEAFFRKGVREKHTQKCLASAKKVAAKDPWRALQVERNSRNQQNHRQAFTDPYYGYG